MLLPLIAADIAHDHGHFNLTVGAIGVAAGAGTVASTALAGTIDSFVGARAAFFTLAVAGLLAALLVWLIMPESGRGTPGRRPHRRLRLHGATAGPAIVPVERPETGGD